MDHLAAKEDTFIVAIRPTWGNTRAYEILMQDKGDFLTFPKIKLSKEAKYSNRVIRLSPITDAILHISMETDASWETLLRSNQPGVNFKWENIRAFIDGAKSESHAYGETISKFMTYRIVPYLEHYGYTRIVHSVEPYSYANLHHDGQQAAFLVLIAPASLPRKEPYVIFMQRAKKNGETYLTLPIIKINQSSNAEFQWVHLPDAHTPLAALRVSEAPEASRPERQYTGVSGEWQSLRHFIDGVRMKSSEYGGTISRHMRIQMGPTLLANHRALFHACNYRPAELNDPNFWHKITFGPKH